MARPRTKVVLPAPISPSSASRSPRRTWRARRAAAASVASGVAVTSSREVVVATLLHLDRTAPAVHDDHAAVARQLADRLDAGGQRGTAAHELDLLAAGQRREGRGAL